MAFINTSLTRVTLALTVAIATPVSAFQFVDSEPFLAEGTPYSWTRVLVEAGDTKEELVNWLVGDQVDLGNMTREELNQTIIDIPQNQAALSFTASGEFRWLVAGEQLIIPVGIAPPAQASAVAPPAPAPVAAEIDYSKIDEKLVAMAKAFDQVRQADNEATQEERNEMRAEYLTLIELASTPVFYATAMQIGLFAEENGLLELTGWTMEDVSQAYRSNGWIVQIVLIVLVMLVLWLVLKGLVRSALPAKLRNSVPQQPIVVQSGDETTKADLASTKEVVADHDDKITQLAGEMTAVQSELLVVKSLADKANDVAVDAKSTADAAYTLAVMAFNVITDGLRIKGGLPNQAALDNLLPDMQGLPIVFEEKGHEARLFLEHDATGDAFLLRGLGTRDHVVIKNATHLQKVLGKALARAVRTNNFAGEFPGVNRPRLVKTEDVGIA